MNLPLTICEAADMNVHDLAVEIADEACVVCIETFARRAPTNYPRGVWDVSAPDPEEARELSLLDVQKDVERAVQYLDMRQLIVRPWADSPQFVSFAVRPA